MDHRTKSETYPRVMLSAGKQAGDTCLFVPRYGITCTYIQGLYLPASCILFNSDVPFLAQPKLAKFW